jgi:GNAT superfamily N-acetyltransferase
MRRDDLSYELTDTPAPADLERVDAGLHLFNLAAADMAAIRPLACFARRSDGTVVGGVRARSWGTAFEIQQVWVDELWRRRGIASVLLQRIEQAARERGGSVIYLDTFSFQAPALYLCNGYSIAWQVGGFPDRIVKYLMVRRLDGR